MDPRPPTADTAARREWLGVLAQCPREALQGHAERLRDDAFEWLRMPQTGLVMLRARVANTGDRFNLGEATVTRCVVRHRDPHGCVAAGVGYVLGRDEPRATWVARFDALLQQPRHHAHTMREVLVPLRQATQLARQRAAAQTGASRVQFSTLSAPPP